MLMVDSAEGFYVENGPGVGYLAYEEVEESVSEEQNRLEEDAYRSWRIHQHLIDIGCPPTNLLPNSEEEVRKTILSLMRKGYAKIAMARICREYSMPTDTNYSYKEVANDPY